MLTVDHVKLRRKKGLIEVNPLCGLERARAVELAGFALDVAKAHEGEARAALEDALDELPVIPKHGPKGADEVRYGRGLKKLVLDACSFDVDTELDPEALRAEVFAAAAAARHAGTFDRVVIVDDAAKKRSVGADEVDRALYADLPSAHAVRGLDVDDAGHLVDRYAVAELQAVLLRAVRVVIDVQASSLSLRSLIRAMKLQQLLFDIDAPDVDGDLGAGGVRFVVEGPMGLFQQSTRYGLKLALMLPHVMACKRYVVDANVKLRTGGPVERLVIRGGAAPAPSSSASSSSSSTAAPTSAAAASNAPRDVPEIAQQLIDDVNADAAARFKATAATEVLRLPGAGLFVPDVQLEDKETGEILYVEVLGFWSRTAVWKRVELVEKGLPYRIIFCASERLRVSEAAIPEDASSALVVFKGVLRASRVLEAAERLAGPTTAAAKRAKAPVKGG